MFSIPLCTTNRINSPEIAEEILREGHADMVSMARPLLADPYFMKKSKENRAVEINTCIGCNQACLDHIFVGKRASCLVNPIAGYETSLVLNPVPKEKQQKIAVVGAGPAGLSAAVTAAKRGHTVTLYEQDSSIGGQFNIAKKIPGKEEFYETIRYFQHQLELQNVNLKLNQKATFEDLKDYDSVILATGVYPRDIKLPVKTAKVRVLSYLDVLRNNTEVGKKVAVIGAGGIGYDVSEFLLNSSKVKSTSARLPNHIEQDRIDEFVDEWGIDKNVSRGGLKPKAPPSSPHTPPRQIYLLQRKAGRLGSTLGKTTGWIHRAHLKKQQVQEIGGCKYIEVNDNGLLIEQNQKQKQLDVDTVVICAGQIPCKDLYDPLAKAAKAKVFLIGGSLEASELDAKRAIDQGTRLAAVIENSKTGDVFNAPIESAHKWMTFFQKFLQK